MAKVSFTFDSDTKQVEISMDGKVVDKVVGFSYYAYEAGCDCDDHGYLSVCIKDKSDNGVHSVKSMGWEWEMESDEASVYTEKAENIANVLIKKLLNVSKS